MSANITGAPSTDIVDIAPDMWNSPFWDAASRHQLVAARCTECGRFQAPATGFCPGCRACSIEWIELSGDAVVYSFTIVRHAVIPELAHTVPYVIAVVTLPDADDVKIMTNIVNCDVDAIRIGDAVHVAWDDVPGGVTVPRFAPAVLSAS